MKNKQQSGSLHPDYEPPSSASISRSQNDDSALRLMLAQRKLYSGGKCWLAVRIWGMGFIAIIAPVLAFVWPASSVVVGAVAGVWIFLGRTMFIALERRATSRGAAVQELFDLAVFEMPKLGNRASAPRLEEICGLAGPDAEIQANAQKEKLIDWYPIESSDSGITSIAICQRANASYSTSLLDAFSGFWLSIIAGWAVILVVISICLKLSLGTFLLGVFLPLLPAFLDTVDFWRGFRQASEERGSLTQEIEAKLADNAVTAEELLVWQSRMYDLRRDMPQIPDWLYGLVRDKNETNMKSAAGHLSDEARNRDGDKQ